MKKKLFLRKFKSLLLIIIIVPIISLSFPYKANAFFGADDAVVIGGVTVSADAIALGVAFVCVAGGNYVYNHSDNVKFKSVAQDLINTGQAAKYLSVEINKAGSRVLSFTKSGIDWLKQKFSTGYGCSLDGISFTVDKGGSWEDDIPIYLGSYYLHGGYYISATHVVYTGTVDVYLKLAKNFSHYGPYIFLNGDDTHYWSGDIYDYSYYGSTVSINLSDSIALDPNYSGTAPISFQGYKLGNTVANLDDTKVDSNTMYHFSNPQKPDDDDNNDNKPKIGIPIFPKSDNPNAPAPSEDNDEDSDTNKQDKGIQAFQRTELPDLTKVGQNDTSVYYPVELPTNTDYDNITNPNPKTDTNPDTGTKTKTDSDYYVVPEPNPTPTPIPTPTPEPTPTPTPEPTPSPNPEPTPNPNPDPDEDLNIPKDDVPKLDFSPLMIATRKFPFCVPWDLWSCYKTFEANEEPFAYTFDEIDVTIDGFTITTIPKFDLKFTDYPQVDTCVKIIKFCELMGFIVMLIVLTRKLIRG